MKGCARVWLGFATSCILVACQDPRPIGQSEPRGVVDALPAVSATADVDRRATLTLKQDLVTRFPQNSPSGVVETGLTKDAFDCGPNPAASEERACLKVVREAACEVNSIVRTQPYAPEKAQVIRICELADPKAEPQSK